jgi:hypothetical protein
VASGSGWRRSTPRGPGLPSRSALPPAGARPPSADPSRGRQRGRRGGPGRRCMRHGRRLCQRRGRRERRPRARPTGRPVQAEGSSDRDCVAARLSVSAWPRTRTITEAPIAHHCDTLPPRGATVDAGGRSGRTRLMGTPDPQRTRSTRTGDPTVGRMA